MSFMLLGNSKEDQCERKQKSSKSYLDHPPQNLTVEWERERYKEWWERAEQHVYVARR